MLSVSGNNRCPAGVTATSVLIQLVLWLHWSSFVEVAASVRLSKSLHWGGRRLCPADDIHLLIAVAGRGHPSSGRSGLSSSFPQTKDLGPFSHLG